MTIVVDETVIARAVRSINTACDWIESNTLVTRRDVVEILDLVLTDLDLALDDGENRNGAGP